jgi:pimeloyl-ACP methyl ester carboxylesterase
MQESKNITYEGSTIHYRVTGEGAPVLLIHGFAEDGSVWDNQVAFLENTYKLVVPDLPGSGKSTILQKDRITLVDYAVCIKKILEKENIDQCVMIGHSMGGYITLAFAEQYPEILKAFGLFHSSAFADDEEKIAVRKKAIDFIKNNGTAAFLSTMIPGLFKDAEESKDQVDLLLQKSNNFSPEALVQYYQAMIDRPDRTAVLKSSKLPVLLVLGQHDKAVPFEQGLKQAKMADNTYMFILRNSGHMGMLEEQEKSNLILADFLQTDDVK